MPYSCAFGCKDSGSVKHSFPNPARFPERFKDWVKLVGYNLETISDHEIYKKKRICDVHFRDEHRNRYKRLNALAIPTLYLPGESHGIKASSGQSDASLGRTHPTSITITSLPSTSTPNVTTIQQCNRNDGAVVKKTLNETPSPPVVHKRPRLEPSQVANKSDTKASSAALNVAITCDRRGVISKEVSDQVLAAIQKQIISEACSPMQDTPGPSFNAKPLFTDGVLKLWCGNDQTLDWLKKTVSGLALPASISLVVKSQSEMQKRVRCGIAVPDDQGLYEDSTTILQALCYQNPWVHVKSWRVLHAKKQKASWFVVLGIPVDQVLTLMSSDRRLSIGLGAVYVKFQDPNGRFVDVPRGWDQTTRQLVYKRETIRPLNNPEATAADPAGAAESAAPVADVGTMPSSGANRTT